MLAFSTISAVASLHAVLAASCNLLMCRLLQAALALAEKKNGELSESLAEEKADRVLYLLKSQVKQ